MEERIIKDINNLLTQLFQKMREAGYKWDAEKKELKLLITNGGDFSESVNCEQKPAVINIDKMVNEYANNKERGNEEFGKPVNCMIRAYRQGLNDAIGKIVLNTAWSNEDEANLNDIIQELELVKKDVGKINHPAYDKLIQWLKSLKQRIGG